MKVGIIGRGKMGNDIKTFFEENSVFNVLISSQENFDLLENCDFVIETTHEDIKIKRKIFDKIKCYSNTSSLEVEVPQIHFMNPAHKNKVVECTEDVPKEIIFFLESVGKKVYVVPKIRGLIVNRVLFGGLSEYMRLRKIYDKTGELCKEALKYDYERAYEFIGKSICETISKELI